MFRKMFAVFAALATVTAAGTASAASLSVTGDNGAGSSTQLHVDGLVAPDRLPFGFAAVRSRAWLGYAPDWAAARIDLDGDGYIDGKRERVLAYLFCRFGEITRATLTLDDGRTVNLLDPAGLASVSDGLLNAILGAASREQVDRNMLVRLGLHTIRVDGDPVESMPDSPDFPERPGQQ